ncbi:MAG: sigma-70 family RNA polymerase sigma factor [Planctomycetes bacterium]|nr:sigma-70 family RNA polymerase sigma factor [Planctomycetota bacterium]
MTLLTRDFHRSVRQARMAFLDAVEPHRADLFRYCRGLAPTVWEAEDLVQETLLRAFAKLAECHWDVKDARAYLLRAATNLWIDGQRRAGRVRLEDDLEPAAAEDAPPAAEVREALAALVRNLPPRERAAVLLKDAFGLDLDEVATYLETTRGAVKAALHRGRARLAARGADAVAVEGRPDGPSAALLDRFCALFNARDLPALTALLLEDATAEVVGMVQEYGREQVEKGSLYHTMFGEEGRPRAALLEYLGEPVVVIWYTGPDGVDAVEDVLRFVEREGRVASLRYSYFCPELIEEVGAALGVPVRTNGHRYRA